MPKLTLNVSAEEKRMQLADMAHRGILGDQQKNEIGDFEFTNGVFTWSDNDILIYYSKNVTDEQADKYAEAVAADAHHTELKQVVTGGKEPERPNVYSFKLLEKMNMIANSGLPDEERADKLNQIREAFEYEKLKFDAAHNSFRSEKDKEYYQKLTKQYSIDVYEQKAAALKADEEELKRLDAAFRKKGDPPRKPSRIARMWNGVRKVFKQKELESVKKYDEYYAAEKTRNDLFRRISTSKFIMEQISETNRNYNYEEHVKNKEEKRLELAKHIVRKTLDGASQAEGKAPVNLTDEELETNANAVMATKTFKKVLAELNADTVETDPNTFYSRFMKEMSEKPATASAENANPIQAQKSAPEQTSAGLSV